MVKTHRSILTANKSLILVLTVYSFLRIVLGAMTFRSIAMENRDQLLVSLSFINKEQGMGPAGTAYEVGQQSYKRGFTEEVKTPKGGLYSSWIRSKKIPAWAARTVACILAEIPTYSPRSENELYSLLLMLAEGYDCHSISDLRSKLSANIIVSDQLLQDAIDSKKISYN